MAVKRDTRFRAGGRWRRWGLRWGRNRGVGIGDVIVLGSIANRIIGLWGGGLPGRAAWPRGGWKGLMGEDLFNEGGGCQGEESLLEHGFDGLQGEGEGLGSRLEGAWKGLHGLKGMAGKDHKGLGCGGIVRVGLGHHADAVTILEEGQGGADGFDLLGGDGEEAKSPGGERAIEQEGEDARTHQASEDAPTRTAGEEDGCG